MGAMTFRPDGTPAPLIALFLADIMYYVDLRERDTGSESVAAFAVWSANLTGIGHRRADAGHAHIREPFAVLLMSPSRFCWRSSAALRATCRHHAQRAPIRSESCGAIEQRPEHLGGGDAERRRLRSTPLAVEHRVERLVEKLTVALE